MRLAGPRRADATRRAQICAIAGLIICLLAAQAGANGTKTPATLQEPGWESEIFYKIFIRSFADSNGDRIGDFPGIERRLDYLARLGVTSLLLTPVVPSTYYHNYFATRFDDVDPAFGDLTSFRHLVRALHARGMKVYLDQEIQYVPPEHAWWSGSFGHPEGPFGQYLIYEDPANTRPDAGFLNGATSLTYDGKPATLAMVNLNLPEVQRYFDNAFAAWVDPHHDGDFAEGVDGFRIDHMMDDLDHRGKVTNLVAGFWAPLLAHTRAIKPDLSVVAEQADWTNFGEDLLQHGGVDLVYAFPLRTALMSLNAGAIATAITATLAHTPPGKGQLIFLENHDTIRFASQVSGNGRKERLGATLNMLLKGSPMLYYGQELGMTGRQTHEPATDGNDIPVREAFRWHRALDAAGSAIWYRDTGNWWRHRYNRSGDGVSVDEEEGNPHSLYEYYRRLIALRRERAELHAGDETVLVNPASEVLVVRRRTAAQESLLIANMSAQAANVVVAADALRDLHNGEKLVELLHGAAWTTVRNDAIHVALPPFGECLLTQARAARH